MTKILVSFLRTFHFISLLHTPRKVKCLNNLGASVVAQWLRICLPMQGTRVRAPVWEDPMCRGATKPVRHNYWACALESPHATTTEPTCHNYWSPHSTTREDTTMRRPCTATKSSPCSPQLEKAHAQQWRPNAAKKKKKKKKVVWFPGWRVKAYLSKGLGTIFITQYGRVLHIWGCKTHG